MCSDAIVVIVTERRHVGGILSVNSGGVKMQRYENSYSKFRAYRFFRLAYNFTHDRWQAYAI